MADSQTGSGGHHGVFSGGHDIDGDLRPADRGHFQPGPGVVHGGGPGTTDNDVDDGAGRTDDGVHHCFPGVVQRDTGVVPVLITPVPDIHPDTLSFPVPFRVVGGMVVNAGFGHPEFYPGIPVYLPGIPAKRKKPNSRVIEIAR